MHTDPIEVPTEETTALEAAWNSVGPPVAFAVKELGREAGLSLCAGLAKGDLRPIWRLEPGHLLCVISRGLNVIYNFEFLHESPRFVFAELGPAN
jgi:hypothetical protein